MEQTEKMPANLKKGRKVDPKMDELIEAGIPLAMVVVGKAVRSFRETVEFAFYHPGDDKLIKPRQAKIWYTPHGVVIEQMGRYKIIPLANVLDTVVL